MGSKTIFWVRCSGCTWKTPELGSLAPNPTSSLALGTSTRGSRQGGWGWAELGPHGGLPKPLPSLAPTPNLCPTLRTFSGHFPELPALILIGTLGKWLFSQQNLFLEPNVSNSQVKLSPWGPGGGPQGLTPHLPSAPSSTAPEEFHR